MQLGNWGKEKFSSLLKDKSSSTNTLFGYYGTISYLAWVSDPNVLQQIDIAMAEKN